MHKMMNVHATCSIIIVTDSRTKKSDVSGKLAKDILSLAGHSVKDIIVCANNTNKIKNAIKSQKSSFVLTIGGTGISKKDLTAGVVSSLIKKELPGFGELFRAMSFKEIGTRTILSRAVMGIDSKGRMICALPGSPAAVKLAVGKIIVKELSHLISELTK